MKQNEQTNRRKAKNGNAGKQANNLQECFNVRKEVRREAEGMMLNK